MVTFVWLRERATPSVLPAGRTVFGAAVDELKTTFAHARRFQDLIRFLVSLVVYQAAIATVFVVAAIYAQEQLGFSTDEIITLILVVNVTAAVGAVVIGQLQDRLGSKVALSLALALWIAALLLMLAFETRPAVWFAANLIGLAMGACQASGRALVGHFTPPARQGEFFGLWGLAVNLAAIIGPLSYGLIVLVSDGDQRPALFSTLMLFVVGWALLLRVDEARGKRNALENGGLGDPGASS